MASCALLRLLSGKARARSVWNPTADRLAAKEQVTGSAAQQ